MRKIKLGAIFLLIIGLGSMQAQEVIPASGGEALGSGGSVSYSVGQVVYTTNTGSNGSVTQGVQQPYEISIVTGAKEAEAIMLELSAYPNPTTNYLTLKVEYYDNKNLSYQLFDINGKLLEHKKLANNKAEIQMTDFVPANYFLKVISNQKEIKTFKIVKN